jgi:hypothetical protein
MLTFLHEGSSRAAARDGEARVFRRKAAGDKTFEAKADWGEGVQLKHDAITRGSLE